MCVNLRQQFPWITDELLQQALWTSGKRMPRIQGVRLQAALASGENFASNILRAVVECDWCDDRTQRAAKRSVESLIVKVIKTPNGIASEMGLFRREICAYSGVIPKCEALLRSIGDETRFAPRCLITNQQDSYLIFEDLKLAGYSLSNKRDGLNFTQLKLVLTKLAKWHATTAALIQQDPRIADAFTEPQMSRTSRSWRAIVENSCQTVADICETLPRFAWISEHLRRVQPGVYDRVCSLVQRRTTDFNVLCHGDMWSNNLMFSDTANEMLMCDFQLVTHASPVLDLIYLLYSSSNGAVTEAIWDDCIAHYHSVLEATLIALRYPQSWPTLGELRREFVSRGFSSALNSVVVVGIRNLEQVPEDVMRHFVGSNEENRLFRLQMVGKPECRRNVEMLLAYFERKGFFCDWADENDERK